MQITFFSETPKTFLWSKNNLPCYTENDSKIGNLARRLPIFLVPREQQCSRTRCERGARKMGESRRRQKPIFESFSVYLCDFHNAPFTVSFPRYIHFFWIY